jgi:signal peptidase II
MWKEKNIIARHMFPLIPVPPQCREAWIVCLADKWCALGETVPLFPSLNLHYARNYGAAFSFLADSGGWQRWFFAGIALGICVILAVLMYRSKATQKLNNIAYALIIGGALGNLFDRLWHGFVVDMIDFYVGDWHFATFNLADSAICIGAALIVLEGFLPKPAAKEQA